VYYVLLHLHNTLQTMLKRVHLFAVKLTISYFHFLFNQGEFSHSFTRLGQVPKTKLLELLEQAFLQSRTKVSKNWIVIQADNLKMIA